MGLIEYDKIPGYVEACSEEEATRELALLADPIPLCGVLVNQFTPRHTIRLGFCKNAFVVGERSITPEDVAMFLWFVSTEYSFDQRRRDKFVRKLESLKFVESVKAINAYLSDAFMDAPGVGSGGWGRAYTAPAASFVHVFGQEYGWPMQQTLNTPWAALFQLLKLIKRHYNPKAILFNPRSDAAVGRWLQERNAPVGGN